MATLAGAVGESFRGGTDLLEEMAGLRLSASTVERTTEDAGERLRTLLGEGITFDEDQAWPWQRDRDGRTVGYISIDATGTRQQEGDGSAKAGRMVYVGSVFNPLPIEGGEPRPDAPKRMQARYVSGLYPLDEMGPLLRRQAASVGLEAAEQWVALSDGGAGLEGFLRSQFNREDLVVILDFWHVASYLEELAQALYPRAPDEAESVASQWCGLLKSEGGAVVLAMLREWEWPTRRSAELRAVWKRVESYLENHHHRMAYPEYLARGWQIGSGVIESACKTVVAHRLKGAGKRWSERGADTVCHVRALLRSQKGQWDAFWRRKHTKRASSYQLS